MKLPRGQKNRDYRLEAYFVGGKMKHRRVSLIDGIEVEEFYLAHADDSILIADGHEDLLFEREEKVEPNQSLCRTTDRLLCVDDCLEF